MQRDTELNMKAGRMNNMTHKEALSAVVHFTEQRDQAYAELIRCSQHDVIYTVRTSDIIAVLNRVEVGDITFDDLPMWASLLEMRGDIDHTQVEGGLYALANPEQMGVITQEKIQTLVSLLST